MSKERLPNETLDNAISTYKTVVEVAGDIIDEDYSPVLDKVTLAFLKELKQYRDLEEQGLLLRLPISIGSKVYSVLEEQVPKHYYEVCEYEIEDISLKAFYCDHEWWEFGCNDFYFTRAEAEEKLRELEGKVG